VQAWLDGSETNNGLALVADSSFNATFDSKENTTTSHSPELDIAFAGGDGTITGVTTATGSGLVGGGTSGTLNLSLTNACATNQVLLWNGSTWKGQGQHMIACNKITSYTGLISTERGPKWARRQVRQVHLSSISSRLVLAGGGSRVAILESPKAVSLWIASLRNDLSFKNPLRLA
jgi:hypothetical protein